jgi:hypothetical protein
MHGFESHVVLAITIPHAPLELLYVKCILLVFKYIYMDVLSIYNSLLYEMSDSRLTIIMLHVYGVFLGRLWL